MIGEILFWGIIIVLGTWFLGGILRPLTGSIFPRTKGKCKWAFYVVSFLIVLTAFVICVLRASPQMFG